MKWAIGADDTLLGGLLLETVGLVITYIVMASW